MTPSAALRAVLRVYAAREPEAFKVAEQFGICELPAMWLMPPRLERKEGGEEPALS
jgi:hypothetical protein